MNTFRIVTLGVFSLFSFRSFAQILDDSTKQVYDYKTTKYFLEEDLLNNHKTLYTADTSIGTFHLSNFILQNNWAYQNLGEYGTATKNIFYTPATDIGTKLGYNVYSMYAFNADNVHYYNTKSPHTNIYYLQGAKGQSNIQFTHTQNISPRWNIGLDLNRVNSVRQLATTTQTNSVDSWAFMLFSSYESKDGKYQVLGNFNHFNHHTQDTGGEMPQSNALNTFSSLLDKDYAYESSIVNLASASSREKWNNFHIYQQFVAFKGLHFFNTIDFKILANTYYDNQFSSTAVSFYKKLQPYSPLDSIHQFTNYKLFDTKIGIKGYFKGFNYRLNLRERLYSYQTQYRNITYILTPSNIGVSSNASLQGSENVSNFELKSESIVGAWASYYFPDSLRRAFAEMELNPANGTLSFRGEYFSKFLRLGLFHIESPATLLENNFSSNVYNWSNDYSKKVTSTNVYANIDYRIGRFRLQPSFNYSLLSNYIYFNENAISTQSTNEINLFKVGFAAEYKYKKLTLFNRVDYTYSSDDVIKMPIWSVNTRIGYEFVYSKVLHINTGVEVYYKSAYNADNYMPLTQQFFLNSTKLLGGKTFDAWGNAVVDVFADFRIRKVRVFLKMSNIGNAILGKGYFVSPYYPGVRSGLNLGVSWPLFD